MANMFEVYEFPAAIIVTYIFWLRILCTLDVFGLSFNRDEHLLNKPVLVSRA